MSQIEKLAKQHGMLATENTLLVPILSGEEFEFDLSCFTTSGETFVQEVVQAVFEAGKRQGSDELKEELHSLLATSI